MKVDPCDLGRMQSLWYDHYHGAVYPLDLFAEPACKKKTRKVKPLVNLCAEYVVKDSTTTLKVSSLIPPELFYILMEEAVNTRKDRAMEVLLSRWPVKILSLKRISDNLFTSLLPLFDSAYLSEVSRQSLRITTCLAHTFLESLKKRIPRKLKCIDLTGFPTAELVLYYTATHCMLAHNETQQNVMVNVYNDAMRRLHECTGKVENQVLEKTVEFLPDDGYVLKLDAFVSSETTHAELCKALAVSGRKGVKLNILIEKLDVTCLGQARINILLEQLQPGHLKGLRLKYNSLSCEDFICLAPVIETFQNMTSLDLSCNSIYVYKNDEACVAMSKVFQNLPNLTRLDLSNNRLKTKLRRLLSDMPKPLQYMRLVACGLTVSDIVYLSMSHHITSVQELDISENCLGISCNALCRCLQAAKNTLLTLEIEDCALSDDHMLHLQPYLSQLEAALYINIAENALSLNQLANVTRGISFLPSVKYFRFSYPKNCYDDEINEDISKAESLEHLMQLVSARRNLYNSNVNLIAVELERVLDDQLFHG